MALHLDDVRCVGHGSLGVSDDDSMTTRHRSNKITDQLDLVLQLGAWHGEREQQEVEITWTFT